MEENNSITPEDNVFTPEELAWRFIMDEEVDSGLMCAFSDENTKEILFEILITIYIEMILNYYKLKYLENTINDENEEYICDQFDNFTLDLTKVDINTLTGIFKEKFNKIKFNLNVIELEQSQYEFIKKNRYCNVMFKDSPQDSIYFTMNSQYLDPKKRYHFVLNCLYKKKEELRDIYTAISICGKFYKIYFTVNI